MTKILNQAQAEAVYSAMCALNNVGGRICALMPLADGFAYVEEKHFGKVLIRGEGTFERHENQAAFATAYGLQLV